MKREDVSKIFEGATEAQISAVLDINSRDIGSAKAKSDGLADQIAALGEQIKQRDADIKSLGEKLTAAQADAGKLTEAQTALSDLQAKYAADRQAWDEQKAAQAYEFAVKAEAGKLKFSSNAAHNDFVRSALDKKMQLDGGKILGFDDFAKREEKTAKAIIMGGSFEIDRVIQSTSSAIDELSFQAEQKINATANYFHNLAIHGTSAASGSGFVTNTFDGLRKLLIGTSNVVTSEVSLTSSEELRLYCYHGADLDSRKLRRDLARCRVGADDYQPEEAVPAGLIRKGDSGEAVTWLQTRLADRGYLRKSEIDGDFGKITLGALLAFQFENGLTVDGLCGGATKAKLVS